MDTIFGFPAKLTIEVDGEEIDVTSTLEVAALPARLEIDLEAILCEVAVERRRRGRPEASEA